MHLLTNLVELLWTFYATVIIGNDLRLLKRIFFSTMDHYFFRIIS